MEEYFECFLDDMGPVYFRAEVPPASLLNYKGKLPEQLLSQWAEHGWSAYSDGIFWTVNPAEYEQVVQNWLMESGIAASEHYQTFARGALGDLYLWNSLNGHLMRLNIFYARYHINSRLSSKLGVDGKIRSFFSTMSRESNDFDDMFEKALKKLGPLKSDEMYGFVPAMALGGPGKFEHLQKVKIIEHIAFLSQLSPLTDWGFPDFETIMKLTE
ncbi:GAD-like domain-containing protein [Pseudomonas sp. NPDC088444]|uniref:GAD-like domain-containing protein n=1 Tax=Pseudomonas sp. NPDC088444 TaxID=3364456 RepID=UPI00384DEDE3